MAVMYVVGDVAPDRPEPRDCFALARDRLREGDIVFCQLETSITERGSRLPQARHAVRGGPAIAPALKDAGFTVVSMAGNHCMDWGQDGFFDTMEALKGQGLGIVGAGADIAQARAPHVVQAGGAQVAFLAYSSILPMGYWAEDRRPGCAPMRAHTLYEQIEHDQPGTPCRIHTYPHREDLAALVADIQRAKARADIVVVSLHWGIHFVPAVLADYQKDVAYAAIDAGADMILGHHAHILKGVELYRGKPIFFSLCNFACDLRMDEAHAASKSFKEIQTLNPDWIPDFGSLYNFPTDSRMTLVVKAVIEDGRLQRVSALPAYVNRDAQPEILSRADPRFDQVLAYLQRISDEAGLAVSFEVSGDEILPLPARSSADARLVHA